MAVSDDVRVVRCVCVCVCHHPAECVVTWLGEFSGV